MKKVYFNIKVILVALAFLPITSCDDEFLVRDPEDAYVFDNFYNTDEQVRASTSLLYNLTWFSFLNKAFYSIGEVGSGNSFTYSSDVNSLLTFAMSSTDPELENSWAGLWATIHQSNALITYLPERVSADVSEQVLNETLGEAYFMRATAYFYLVRLWGPVPIITNNLDYIDNPQINTNRIEDIYKFVELSLLDAIEKLPEKTRGSNYQANARLSKGSAKAMLAKVYLYMKEYGKARQYAEEVINSGEFKLYGSDEIPGKTFGDLFLTANNNNEESIFSLQWAVSAQYGTANNVNTQFAYSNYINEASYGGVFAPSQDILGLYSDDDVRRKETIMLPGDVYPNITTADGPGLTVPDDINPQNAGAGIKKYVIGKSSDLAGPFDQWAMMTNSTYLLRYADLLLIHTESIMGNGGSTSDPTALASLNKVRNRAGLPSVSSVTFDELFNERRKELAFEGDFWYDLGRIPRSQAIAILSAQNRGDQSNPAYYTPSESDFIMPYPSAEVVKNPLLMEAPVPYNFD